MDTRLSAKVCRWRCRRGFDGMPDPGPPSLRINTACIGGAWPRTTGQRCSRRKGSMEKTLTHEKNQKEGEESESETATERPEEKRKGCVPNGLSLFPAGQQTEGRRGDGNFQISLSRLMGIPAPPTKITPSSVAALQCQVEPDLPSQPRRIMPPLPRLHMSMSFSSTDFLAQIPPSCSSICLPRAQDNQAAGLAGLWTKPEPVPPTVTVPDPSRGVFFLFLTRKQHCGGLCRWAWKEEGDKDTISMTGPA